MRVIDRFRGCLLGGAAGDALGYPVEFDSEQRIRSKYGDDGIREYELTNGAALISDDTQMTLFTAAGLLVCTTQYRMRGVLETYPDCVRRSYRDWLLTQRAAVPARDDRTSWLVNVPELYSRRAPGTTCLLALERDEKGTIEAPVNNSKGCGGVMRVAPVGLYFCDSAEVRIQESDRIAAECAAITHGHPLGWLSAAALSHIVRRLAENEGETVRGAVEDAIRALAEVFPEPQYRKDVKIQSELLQRAMELAENRTEDGKAIRELGEGWVGEEALGIAAYCAMKYPNDFEKAIVAAVNHKGDSDSTGAITGNILGAVLGMKAIPQKYLIDLELREVILELADDLWSDCRMEEYGKYRDPVWLAKYLDPQDTPGKAGE